MGKKEKEAAKKARKLAARAKRAQQESAANEEKDPGFGGTAATPTATAPTSTAATSAVPRFGEAPQVSVDQVSLSADPLPLDRLGDDIKAFRSVVGRRDRRGKPLSAPLVQSCVAGCLGYGATAADAATFTERTTAASVETNGSEDEMSLGSVFARGFGADGAALSFRKRLLFDFPFPACELIA